MLCRRKISPLKRKIRRILAIVLVFTLSIIVYFELMVKDQLSIIIISELETIVQRAVTQAVDDYIAQNKDVCDKLISINTDSNDDVKSITTNSYNINSIKTEITNLSQEYIDNLTADEGVNIQSGNFTGLVIFTNVGPYIHFEVSTLSTISCEFQSTFESVGINQAIHHIELIVNADLNVYNPYVIEGIVVETSYEIAQTVVVGTIPSTYGNVLRY